MAYCLLMTGCGFQPVYGKHAEAGRSLAGIKVDPIGEGRTGQLLRIALEDRLNPRGSLPPAPAYRLSVTLDSQTTPIGVARDATVSRYNIHLNANYSLYRNGKEEPIDTGSVHYVNSYNNLTNEYFSTYVSEQDAVRRGIAGLSELIRQRLASRLAEDGA